MSFRPSLYLVADHLIVANGGRGIVITMEGGGVVVMMEGRGCGNNAGGEGVVVKVGVVIMVKGRGCGSNEASLSSLQH